MGTKIYLAKSNMANPNIIIKFKKFIRDYAVEVREFKGGVYNHSQQFENVEVVFVIAPGERPTDKVGKGLYGQIQYVLNNNIPIFMVDSLIRFNKILSVKIYNNHDWYATYGVCEVDQYSYNLIDYLPVNTIKDDLILLI